MSRDQLDTFALEPAIAKPLSRPAAVPSEREIVPLTVAGEGQQDRLMIRMRAFASTRRSKASRTLKTRRRLESSLPAMRARFVTARRPCWWSASARLKDHGLTPLGRIVAWRSRWRSCDHADEPVSSDGEVLGTCRPVACRHRFVRGHEAFASVPLAWQGNTGADPASSTSGGAIALGHPCGSDRSQAGRDPGPRTSRARRPLWPADHVRGRRDRQRHDRRGARLTSYDVLIVGSGHGGVATASTLRQLGFAGTIGIVSADRDEPYERPPLSKEYCRRKRIFTPSTRADRRSG